MPAKKTTKATAQKASPKVMKGLINEIKKTLLTRDGLQAVKDELEYLESVKRKEIAARIKEAVSYGDLSENSEYEEAKNEQAFVEGRILQLTEQIKYAHVIEDDKVRDQSAHGKIVQLGNKVVIKVMSGKMEGEKLNYTIVGTTEADPLNHRISNESPVGAALLDKKIGEKVSVDAPAGVIQYKILEIA